MTTVMQQIDEARLETDTQYRFAYLQQFMGFDATDIDAIHASAPLLAPLVPGLVDAVCALFRAPVCWAGFIGLAGGTSVGLRSVVGLGSRAPPSALGFRSVIVSPGLVPGCARVSAAV